MGGGAVCKCKEESTLGRNNQEPRFLYVIKIDQFQVFNKKIKFQE